MIEAYLGPEDFRAGVTAYLKQHAYGNATTDDFFQALAAASNKPVDRITKAFVEQPGVPLVSVKLLCRGGDTKVTLSQKRYYHDQTRLNTGDQELWFVPVCMKAGSEDGKNREECRLLSQKQDSFTLSGCVPWVLGNAGATGYYLSEYEPAAVRALLPHLETALTPAERIRLLNDVWASVRMGAGTIGDFLTLAQGFHAERNRAVLEQVSDTLDYIGEYLVTDADRESYQSWVRDLLRPVAKELGWQPAQGESTDRSDLRARVLYTLGYTGRDPDVLAEAAKLAHEALNNRSALDPTMAGTVFNLAALRGDGSLYNKIMEQAQESTSPEQHYILVKALEKFDDPRLLERTLQFALTPAVRTQDMPSVIAGVMHNPAGRRLAWDFVRQRWARIEKEAGVLYTERLVGATGSFCDADLQAEVKDFYAMHPQPGAERTLRQSLERIQYCADLKLLQADKLAAWLQHRESSGGQ
jgi:aminopeptidase N